MMRFAVILISAGLVALALGCSRSPPTPATPTPATPAASYSYDVRDDGVASAGMAEDVNATAGKNRLEIHGGRLTANGKSYGSLKNGDAVLLNADGQLFVNGQNRQPE
jgi:hypothetical protein